MPYNTEYNKRKKCHVKDRANFCSLFFFWWTLQLLYKKWKNKLKKEDYMTPLKYQSCSKLRSVLEQQWNHEINTSKNPSLFRALFKTFGFKFISHGLIYFIADCLLTFLQPYYLLKMMEAITKKDRNNHYFFAVLFLYYVRAFSANYFFAAMSDLASDVRIACTSLVFQKVMNFKRSTLHAIGTGKIINVLTGEVEHIDLVMRTLHYLWMAPLKIFMAVFFSWRILGISAFGGLAVNAVVLLLQYFIVGKFSSKSRKIAVQANSRVGLVKDIIRYIQTIKMYTWEEMFDRMITKIRNQELKFLSEANFAKGLIRSPNIFLSKSSVFFCALLAFWTGAPLKSYYIYVLTHMYFYINYSSCIYATGIIAAFDYKVTLTQMEELLLENTKNLQVMSKDKSVGIYFDNVTLKKHSDFIYNVSLEFKTRELVGLVGPAGSGKTLLFQTIFQDIDIDKGNVYVNGSISYCSQEPWIFPGTVRQNILFGKKFNQRRYEEVIRICALTEDLALFPLGDNALVGERGVKLSGGQRARLNLARAVYRNADIYLLDDPFSAVDGQVANHIFYECIKKFLKDKIVILVTCQNRFLENMNQIILLKDGKVSSTRNYTQFREVIQSIESPVKTFDTEESVSEEAEECIENKSIFITYLYTHCNKMHSFSLLLLHLICQVIICTNDYYLSSWINRKKHNDFITTPQDLHNFYQYTILTISLIIASFLTAPLFRNHTVWVSNHLHNSLFTKVLRGSMSFYNNHFSGRILERFSEDMTAVDLLIPEMLQNFLRLILLCVGNVIMIMIANKWMAIPTVFLLLLFYILTKVFISSIHFFKQEERINSGPVCTHISACLYGLSTIKALKAQHLVIKTYEELQDRRNSVFLVHKYMSYAFTFWIDVVCAFYTTSAVVFLMLQFNEDANIGFMGLAITEATSFLGSFQWATKMTCSLEALSSSVNRIANYTDLKEEEDAGIFIPPINWPSGGNIVYDSVFLKYSSEKPYVLKDINFEGKAGEKIGIVGRTGAGKSSLISVLFRLFDFEGTVYIDDVDTKYIPLKRLRSKISIIPQDPAMFAGTLRDNLDPFKEFTDADLWSALEDVNLRSFVSDLPSGLDHMVLENGSNLSAGQKQLFCLVRVFLEENKIVVLDEATANIDSKTDELIQKTLRRKFQKATVLTIAHRLETVLDSDKILVISSGTVVEFGSVEALLGDEQGHFYKYYSDFYHNRC